MSEQEGAGMTVTQPDEAEIVPFEVDINNIPDDMSIDAFLEEQLRHMRNAGKNSVALFIVVERNDYFQAEMNLLVGISSTLAAASWNDPTGRYVPGPRHNTARRGTADFYHPTGLFFIPLWREQVCSRDLLRDMLEEVRRTKRKPECVSWVPAIDSPTGAPSH